MRNFYLLAFLALGIFACQKEVVKKPNVVFIFADDLSYRAVHALGNEVVQTPNMDRIAEGGTTFTHAYNMGGWNGAVCVASRAMIISGRSIWRAKQQAALWKDSVADSRSETWGKLMEADGYNTYMTGKWHVSAPAGQVFQTAKHIRPGMPRDAFRQMAEKFKRYRKGEATLDEVLPVGYNRPKGPEDKSWTPADTSFGGFWEGGKHWSEVVKDDALEFIADATTKDNPFFMYLAFNAPHDPRQAPQEYVDMYAVDDIPVPPNFLPLYPYKDSIGLGPTLRDEALAPFPRTEYAVQVNMLEYYAIITHLDEQIGKILDALEESGEADNTYIFFSADHGLSVGRHGLIGKQNMYDHSMRVPLMVAGPDIPRGKKISQDVYLQDIMASALEVADIEKPSYVEFESLIPLARGEQASSAYDEIYGCYIDLQRMIRKDNYKLIVYPKISKCRLFDLKSDPEEMNDLAELPEHQEKVKSMFADLMKLQEEMGDELSLDNIFSALP